MIWLYNGSQRQGNHSGIILGGDWIKADVIKNDDSYVIEAELPGFAMEEIDLQLENNALKLTAKRPETKTDTSGQFLKRERGLVERKRSWALPKDADLTSIKASQKNGILTIEIKKKPEEKAKKIKIKAA